MGGRLRAEHGGGAGVLHDALHCAFLLIVISLSGMIFGLKAARVEIAAQPQGLMGREGASKTG